MKSRWAFWMLVVVILAAGACAREQTVQQTDSTYTTSQDTSGLAGPVSEPASPDETTRPPDTTSSGPISPASDSTTPPPSGSLRQLRADLRTEAFRLDHAVSTADYAQVVRSATKVRDLATSLGGKTGELPKSNATQIEDDVHQVTELTEAMRLKASTKTLAGLKSDNAQLQPILARLLKLSGPLT